MNFNTSFAIIAEQILSVEDDDQKLEYDDLETVLENNTADPILLCLEDKQKDDYETMVKRRFDSHVTVESELYTPE
jgi:hypothetical protein